MISHSASVACFTLDAITHSFLWWVGCGASLVATVYKQVEEWILIAIVLQSLTPIEVASIPLKVFVPIGTGKAFVLVHLPLPSLRGGLSGADGVPFRDQLVALAVRLLDPVEDRVADGRT